MTEEKAALEKRVHQLSMELQKAQLELEKEKENHSSALAASTEAKSSVVAASKIARPVSTSRTERSRVRRRHLETDYDCSLRSPRVLRSPQPIRREVASVSQEEPLHRPRNLAPRSLPLILSLPRSDLLLLSRTSPRSLVPQSFQLADRPSLALPPVQT